MIFVPPFGFTLYPILGNQGGDQRTDFIVQYLWMKLGSMLFITLLDPGHVEHVLNPPSTVLRDRPVVILSQKRVRQGIAAEGDSQPQQSTFLEIKN